MTAPTALPTLSHGAHPHADAGACLLEYCSILAGETFSDHPATVHPVLATAGRLVNDNITDPSTLLPLAARLIGTGHAGPAAARGIAAHLALYAAHRALTLVNSTDEYHECARIIDTAERWLAGKASDAELTRYGRTNTYAGGFTVESGWKMLGAITNETHVEKSGAGYTSGGVIHPSGYVANGHGPFSTSGVSAHQAIRELCRLPVEGMRAAERVAGIYLMAVRSHASASGRHPIHADRVMASALADLIDHHHGLIESGDTINVAPPPSGLEQLRASAACELMALMADATA